MHRLAWARRLVVCGLDAVSAASTALHVRLATWRDQLEPPPPVDPTLTERILARVVVAAAPASTYRPTVSDVRAAGVAERQDCPIYLLEDATSVAFVCCHAEREVLPA